MLCALLVCILAVNLSLLVQFFCCVSVYRRNRGVSIPTHNPYSIAVPTCDGYWLPHLAKVFWAGFPGYPSVCLKLANMDISASMVLSVIWRLIMNISFTEKQAQYIAAQIDGGDYQNASEVVRDALRLHEFYRHRVIDELRAEIAKGWDGATSTKTVQDIIADKRRSKRK